MLSLSLIHIFSPSESEEPELPEPQGGESQLVSPGTVMLELPDDPPGPEPVSYTHLHDYRIGDDHDLSAKAV